MSRHDLTDASLSSQSSAAVYSSPSASMLPPLSVSGEVCAVSSLRLSLKSPQKTLPRANNQQFGPTSGSLSVVTRDAAQPIVHWSRSEAAMRC